MFSNSKSFWKWWINVSVAPRADGPVWKEAERTEEPVQWGRSVKANSVHEAGQRVQTEHPPTEEAGDERAARPRSVGVHILSFSNLSVKDFTPFQICLSFGVNLPDSATKSPRNVKIWQIKSRRSQTRSSSWRPKSRVWEMCAAKRHRRLRSVQYRALCGETFSWFETNWDSSYPCL